MTGAEQKVKRVMTPDQLENLRKAREKANVVRQEKADLRRMERETKLVEKMAKEKEIKAKYGKIKEPEPQPEPEPEPEESSSEEEQEVVVKKKKVVKKKPKKKVIYVSENDDSSSEEEVVYKKKKKAVAQPVERDPYEHLDPRKRAMFNRFMNGKIM